MNVWYCKILFGFYCFLGSHGFPCSQKCYCDYNKVQCNDKCLETFPTLQSIPKEVKWLNFNRNRIENVTLAYEPKGTFPNATHFHLDYNNLRVLPGRKHSLLSAFPGLKFLSLTYNSMLNIATDALLGFRHLQQIMISYNKIGNVGAKTFAKLIQLCMLRLDNNQIETIAEDAFFGLAKLNHLDLSANLLNMIRSTWFESLASLQTLLLSNNRISAFIPDGFSWPNSLTTLDLQSNKLTMIPPVPMNDCRKQTSSNCWIRKTKLLLQGNDIYCGCRRPEHNKTMKNLLLPTVSVCCIDIEKTCHKAENGKLSQNYSLNFFWKYIDKPVCKKPNIKIKAENELCKATGEPKPNVNVTTECVRVENMGTAEENQLILSVTCEANNIYGSVRDVAYFNHESCLSDEVKSEMNQDLNGTTDNFRDMFKSSFYIFPRWSVVSLFCMSFILFCILIMFAMLHTCKYYQ